jgi:hypothetical protein
MHTAGLGMPTNFSLICSMFYLSPDDHIDWEVLIFYSLLWIYVAWEWFQWSRAAEKVNPKWRVLTAFAGLCFATLSMALRVLLILYASIASGFSYPVRLFCINIGLLGALLGLAGSIAGKGKIRLGVALISALNLLLWIEAAMITSEFPRQFGRF